MTVDAASCTKKLTHVFFCVSKNVCVSCAYTQGKREQFSIFNFFFFNDTATTEIYTLSLHDALPISPSSSSAWPWRPGATWRRRTRRDRKSTRLNSSHVEISYAVFCLKKKKTTP